ncbi:hypothetical protein, partial [Escherichia coli]
TMILPVFITVISDHDKPQPPGCLLEASVTDTIKALAVQQCVNRKIKYLKIMSLFKSALA